MEKGIRFLFRESLVVNVSDVRAELQTMAAGSPSHILRDVVRRKLAAGVPIIKVTDIVDPYKTEPRPCASAGKVEALTGKTPSEVTNEFGADCPGMTNRDAFAVGEQDASRWLSWK